MEGYIEKDVHEKCGWSAGVRFSIFDDRSFQSLKYVQLVFKSFLYIFARITLTCH